MQAPPRALERKLLPGLVFMQMLMATLLALLMPRGPRRAARITAQQQPALPLEPRARSLQLRAKSWSCSCAMLLDWRQCYTESGTWLMAFCVVEGAWQMGRHSFERALHLHIALGLSRGFSLALIVALVAAQCTASASLLFRSVYLRVGSIAPSSALVCTLWFEALVFGDAADKPTLIRVTCLTLTCSMLALFRYDRQARNTQQQVPTSGVLLSVESHVRRVCSSLRTGLVLPPTALVLVIWGAAVAPFRLGPGIEYEWKRSKFQSALTLAALMLLAAGQDTRAHLVLGDGAERLYDRLMRHKEDLLGQPRVTRWLGSKKDF